MAVGTRLPNTTYLQIANPPSRNAVAGLTEFMWIRLPSPLFNSYHSVWEYHYPGALNLSEGFMFGQASSTTATAFFYCNGSTGGFENVGSPVYDANVWMFFAEVFTNVAGTVTRRTYLGTTAGAQPTLISTRTWTIEQNPDTPDFLYIGHLTQNEYRDLGGDIQYYGIAQTAMTLEQLAAQSASDTATIPCWIFIAAEAGVIADTSGNGRTITVVGTPTSASSGAPIPSTIEADLTIGFTLSGELESITSPSDMIVNMSVGMDVSSSISAVGSMTGDVGAMSIAVDGTMLVVGELYANLGISLETSASASASGSLTADLSISTDVSASASGLGSIYGGVDVSVGMSGSMLTLPRVICYGHSIIAGYRIDDPADYMTAQLETMLAGRVDDVVQLGFSGETAAQLDAGFDARVTPHVEAGRETILVFLGMYNSALNGDPAETILASVWSICSKARALGCKVVVCNEFAGQTVGLNDSILVACNAAIATQWPSHAEGYVDTRSVFYDYTDTSLYHSDQVHFTPLGQHTLAEMVYVPTDAILNGQVLMVAGLSFGLSIEGSIENLIGENDLVTNLSMSMQLASSITGVGDLQSESTISSTVSGALISDGDIQVSSSIVNDLVGTLHGTGNIYASMDVGLDMQASAVVDAMLCNFQFGITVDSIETLGSTEMSGALSLSVDNSNLSIGIQPGPMFCDFPISFDVSGSVFSDEDIVFETTIGMSLTGMLSDTGMETIVLYSLSDATPAEVVPFSVVRVWNSAGYELNLGVITDTLGRAVFEVPAGSYRMIVEKPGWGFYPTVVNVVDPIMTLNFNGRRLETNWLQWEDLETVVDSSVIDQLFNDTNTSSRKWKLVEDVMRQAEAVAETMLLRSWNRSQIIDLAHDDPAIRANAAWLALEFASERRREFISADGKGRYWAQHERSMKFFEILSKSQSHSRGEARAGKGSNSGGSVRPTLRPKQARRIFSDEPDGSGHGGF